MSKNLRGLWFYVLIKVQNATSLVFLTWENPGRWSIYTRKNPFPLIRILGAGIQAIVKWQGLKTCKWQEKFESVSSLAWTGWIKEWKDFLLKVPVCPCLSHFALQWLIHSSNGVSLHNYVKRPWRRNKNPMSIKCSKGLNLFMFCFLMQVLILDVNGFIDLYIST